MSTPSLRVITQYVIRGHARPLRSGGKRGTVGERQRTLADPQFQQLLVDAARVGVRVRTLAAVLFGATPGKASDDVARAIDACDPTARQVRRR